MMNTVVGITGNSVPITASAMQVMPLASQQMFFSRVLMSEPAMSLFAFKSNARDVTSFNCVNLLNHSHGQHAFGQLCDG